MNQHTGEYPVREMCRVLRVSRSGYYAWRARRTRSISKRQKANDELLQAIREVHDSSKQRFGAYKVYRKLRQLGWQCGRHRVARLMRQNGLQSRRVARFKVTTRAQHNLSVAPNVLNREFTAAQPNTKWVSDITFVPTREGWLYPTGTFSLAVVLDLFSRRVVGWSLNERMTRQLVINAFTTATQARQMAIGADTHLLFHSDQGGQYAATTSTICSACSTSPKA